MPAPTPEDLVRAIAAAGITDSRLLAAARAVPRAHFVPPELADGAYQDRPLTIAHDQVTTQPSLVARMIQGLALSGTERVLEIGTGSGWQTALLARLARLVWSIERWPDLAAQARAALERAGTTNAEVVVGDGTVGLADQAPYDAVLVSAAFPAVPEPLADQLRDGGRLVQPIGRGGTDVVVLFEKRAGKLVRRRLLADAHFVRLYGRHGFREAD